MESHPSEHEKLYNLLQNNLQQVLENHFAITHPTGLSREQNSPSKIVIWVGYSGGLDSTVLLYLLKQFTIKQPDLNIELRALHVDHKLAIEANEWVEHCKNFCEQIKIPLETFHLEQLSKLTNCSEEKARDLRYQVFEQQVGKNHLLCLGHHANDQAETMLFRLIRGSGVHGLASIPQSRQIGKGFLIRPLLHASRKDLLDFAQNERLSWVEDPSNKSLDFDRNYLRHQILPVIKKRWPKFQKSMSNNSLLFFRQSKLLDELAELDYQSIKQDYGFISLIKLRQLTQERQANFLTWWLRTKKIGIPSQKRITDILHTLQNCALDKQFNQSFEDHLLLQSGTYLALVPQNLFIVKASHFKLTQCSITQDKLTQDKLTQDKLTQVKLTQVKLTQDKLTQDKLTQCNLAQENSFQLTDYCTIKIKLVKGVGFDSELLKDLQVSFGIRPASLLLAGRQHSKKSKQLFQEADIPSWLRTQWPVLSLNDEIVAIPGIGTVKKFAVTKKQQGVALSCCFDLGAGFDLKNQWKFERFDKSFNL